MDEVGNFTSKSGKLDAQNEFMGMSSLGSANDATGFVQRGGFFGIESCANISIDQGSLAIVTYFCFLCVCSVVHSYAVDWRPKKREWSEELSSNEQILPQFDD
jgi:hypothetical protein